MTSSVIFPPIVSGTVFCLKIFAPFVALRTGWSAYFSYDLKFAGMGLACVFMTVLGFDNITNGLCLSVSLISIRSQDA